MKQIANNYPSCIYYPRKLIQFAGRNCIKIVGKVFANSPNDVKFVFLKVGGKLKVSKVTEYYEYEFNVPLRKGINIFKIYNRSQSKVISKLGTRIIIRLSGDLRQNSKGVSKVSGILFPKFFLNKSNDGHISCSGIFYDSKGEPAEKIVFRIGSRKIFCENLNGNEFHQVLKTGNGFKLLKVEAITKSSISTKIGSKLFYVSNIPRINLCSRINSEKYKEWLSINEYISDQNSHLVNDISSKLNGKVKISLIINGKSIDKYLLSSIISSLESQFYKSWELIITANSKDKLRNFTDNPSIRFIENKKDESDPTQYNLAASETNSDLIIFVCQETRFPPHALLLIAQKYSQCDDIKILYGDVDYMQIGGYRTNPDFKTNFDRIRLLNHNYIGNTFAIDFKTFERLKGFKTDKRLDHFHDLLLRASKLLSDQNVIHLPFIISHRIVLPKFSNWNCDESRMYTIKENFSSSSWKVSDQKGILCVRPTICKIEKLISIIMPSACKIEFLSKCLESIFSKTAFLNYEIILVVNEIRFENDEQSSLLKKLDENKNIRIIIYKDQPFNYSKLVNLGAKNAKGDILCLLNDDIEVISNDWLEELVSWLSFPNVGAVGSRLLFPNGNIQHAGITLGVNGSADHVEKGMRREDAGDYARILFPRQFSAVTAGCLLVKKKTFTEVEGFDENLAQAYNDVDFCLKLKDRGYLVVWNPFSELIHHESVSVEPPYASSRRQTFRNELAYFISKYGSKFKEESFYSSNHSISPPYFELAFPPRVLLPWNKASFQSWKEREALKEYICDIKYDCEKVAVFSHFDQDNIIDNYVLPYLKELKTNGWCLIFVTSCPSLSKIEISKVESFVSKVLVSDGEGRDWGNYGLGLSYAFKHSAPKKVLFINDSLYGPVSPIKQLLERAEESSADLIGITESPQNRYHLQSYFIYCKTSLTTHPAFLTFWASFIPQPNKNLIIEKNELAFTEYFSNLGFKPYALISYELLFKLAQKGSYSATDMLQKGIHVNPTHHFGDLLLTRFDFPFVKIELLRDNPSKIPNIESLKYILKTKNAAYYRIVINHLERVKNKLLIYVNT